MGMPSCCPVPLKLQLLLLPPADQNSLVIENYVPKDPLHCHSVGGRDTALCTSSKVCLLCLYKETTCPTGKERGSTKGGQALCPRGHQAPSSSGQGAQPTGEGHDLGAGAEEWRSQPRPGGPRANVHFPWVNGAGQRQVGGKELALASELEKMHWLTPTHLPPPCGTKGCSFLVGTGWSQWSEQCTRSEKVGFDGGGWVNVASGAGQRKGSIWQESRLPTHFAKRGT